MSMRPSDTLLGPERGKPADVYAYCKGYGREVDAFLRDYVEEIYRLAPKVGIDASIPVAQSCHECFNPDTKLPWDSYWYRSRGNVAGIGITGDPTQNAASGTWQNGTDAARAHIVHLCAYVYGEDYPKIIDPYIHLDPRFHLAVESVEQ